jgi:hypothetical protein
MGMTNTTMANATISDEAMSSATVAEATMTEGPESKGAESRATVERAVERYMAANGFTKAEYVAASVPVKVGPITFKLPNGPARQKAIAQHDVHHVLTGYATDLRGEAEIGAWELRAGCTNAFLWLINLAAVTAGLFIAPTRIVRAFRAARGARTLYRLNLTASEVEPLTVAELRRRAGVPSSGYASVH